MRAIANLTFGVVVVIAAVVAITFGGSASVRPAPSPEPTPVPAITREVPACAEDVVLVGQGDFVDGYWSEYVCGPAVDDYVDGDIGTAIIGFPDGTVITLP